MKKEINYKIYKVFIKNYKVYTSDIPKIIKLFKENEIEKAGEILFNNNPLSLICGIVCPHEEQCYGNCIRNNKDTGVKFYEIEQSISGKYLENLKLQKEESKNKSIAVVGAGPAGITSSLILSQKGYDVTLFEAKEKIGGMLTYGIPDFRLDAKIIQKIEKMLIDLGVKIRYSSFIGSVITIDKLKKEYDAVFIANGVWSPKSAWLDGETLGNCHYAIDYLNANKSYNLGDNVIVIGAGNVAMDASRVAKRNGSKNVKIVYRKDFCDMVATNFEIEEAKEDGVLFEVFKSPVKITKEGVIFIDCKKEFNEDKTFKMIEIEGSEKLMKCDSVIIAIGQNPRTELSDSSSLEVDKYGFIKVDDYKTNIEGVFSAGDIVTGAKTVVSAVNGAKYATDEIINFLSI